MKEKKNEEQIEFTLRFISCVKKGNYAGAESIPQFPHELSRVDQPIVYTEESDITEIYSFSN